MDSIYKVPVFSGQLNQTVAVPGSKSITNRALLAGALADGPVEIRNVLFSDDSRHFMDCLSRLGFSPEIDEPHRVVRINGLGGDIPQKIATIDVGSAGTAARFITAMLAIVTGIYEVQASPQMAARPMKPLLDCLRELGAEFEFRGAKDYLPFQIGGHGLQGGRVTLDSGTSSQFLSALLLVGCYARRDLEIIIRGDLPAKPFVDMTLQMMAEFGVRSENYDYQQFLVSAKQRYQSRTYLVEPDISNANYFLAMAVVTGGTVRVQGIRRDSLQGDLAFIKILEQMGAVLEWLPDGLQITGPADGKFMGVDADMGAMPDQTMTLAAIAPFATTPTTIRNVGFIKFHESNRIQAILNELTRLGITARETIDGMVIYPGQPQPAEIETYDDHRMAMAFALVGLRAPGIVIKNPGCTKKTFENYFELFERVVGV